jgi:hypothetical protein
MSHDYPFVRGSQPLEPLSRKVGIMELTLQSGTYDHNLVHTMAGQDP